MLAVPGQFTTGAMVGAGVGGPGVGGVVGAGGGVVGGSASRVGGGLVLCFGGLGFGLGWGLGGVDSGGKQAGGGKQGQGGECAHEDPDDPETLLLRLNPHCPHS